MVFVLGRAAANETTSGDLVSQIVFFLLTAIPYQGFFIWAVVWLTLDSVRGPRGRRAAVAEACRSPHKASGDVMRRAS